MKVWHVVAMVAGVGVVGSGVWMVARKKDAAPKVQQVKAQPLQLKDDVVKERARLVGVQTSLAVNGLTRVTQDKKVLLERQVNAQRDALVQDQQRAQAAVEQAKVETAQLISHTQELWKNRFSLN